MTNEEKYGRILPLTRGPLRARVFSYAILKEDCIMKYCPFCGADLLSPDVSFCAECGKQLPAGSAPQTESTSRPQPVENPQNPKKKLAPVKPKREPKKKVNSSIEGAPTESNLDNYVQDARY